MTAALFIPGAAGFYAISVAMVPGLRKERTSSTGGETVPELAILGKSGFIGPCHHYANAEFPIETIIMIAARISVYLFG